MEGDVEVGQREALIQTVFQHGDSALAQLLGRLADQHQRAGPFIGALDQLAGRTDQAGHVGVVGAGVHGRVLDAAMVHTGIGGGIGQAGLLAHRQAVHVSAQHQGRPLAVLHHRHDAGAADLIGDLKAQGPQLGGQTGRGLDFLVGEFGMGVEVLVERFQVIGIIGLDRPAQGIIARGVLGLGPPGTGQSHTDGAGHGQKLTFHGDSPLSPRSGHSRGRTGKGQWNSAVWADGIRARGTYWRRSGAGARRDRR